MYRGVVSIILREVNLVDTRRLRTACFDQGSANGEEGRGFHFPGL